MHPQLNTRAPHTLGGQKTGQPELIPFRYIEKEAELTGTITENRETVGAG